MKLIITTLLLLLFGHYTLTAQNWVWAAKFGNTKSEKVTAVKTDSAGHLYIAGYFSKNTTIGTNAVPIAYIGSANSKEAFVAKLDSTGYCYWARVGGAYFDDRVLGMDVDADGNSVITGTYWEGAGINWAGNMVTGMGGGDQCFVVKHDANGNYVWGDWISSNAGDDQGTDVCLDLNGNAYVVGFMNGSKIRVNDTIITASTGVTNNYLQPYWIAKINKNGVPQWVRTFGNLPYDTSASKYIERDIAVCTDRKGGIYITGGFDHSHPFGSTTLNSVGGYDIFVMKYDTSGNFVWAKSGGSDKDDWANGITADNKGNVYVTGEHRDSLLYDTTIIKNYNGRDVFVLKLDATTGNSIWGKRAGTTEGSERGNDIIIDTACNLYVVGDVCEGAKFGDKITVPNNGNGIQQFVAKMEPDDGKFTWVITGGSVDSNDRNNAVAIGKGTQVYSGGYFRIGANYGNLSSLTSAGSSDGVYMRIYDSVKKKACYIEPTPDTLNGAVVSTPIASADTIVNPLYVPIPPDSTVLNFANVFSPNGDGKNDVFYPIFSKVDISKIIEYRLLITNRYGQLVYQTYLPTDGWNGKYKNNELAELSTYFYHCTYTTPQGNKKVVKGDVLLIK
jgi:gliding motility-associated-like protein